jgi:hypothetical protein
MPYLILTQILPKAGFTYRNKGGNLVTQRREYDTAVQNAIRHAGIRWSRPGVTNLLVSLFEMATVTLQAVYVPTSDDITAIMAVYEALDITHRATDTAWAAGLDPSIFYQLVLGIRAARRVSLKETLGGDEAEVGSWAWRLARAVDSFDEALYKRGWSGANELRALEGVYSEGDEEAIREARSRITGEQGEMLCESLDGMLFSSRGGEVEDDGEDDVEIITEREGWKRPDGELSWASWLGNGHDLKEEKKSMEPYLGSDS